MSEETLLPPAPEAVIMFGERKIELRCDLYAMRLYKEETGVSLIASRDSGDGPDPISVETLPELLWAFAVSQENATEAGPFTVADAARLIHPGNMTEVVSVITDLISKSLPASEDGAGNDETGDDESIPEEDEGDAADVPLVTTGS